MIPKTTRPRERNAYRNRISGSMSGMWKRTMAGLVRHGQKKEAATDRPNLP